MLEVAVDADALLRLTGAFVLVISADGVIHAVNPALAATVGRHPDELLGAAAEEVVAPRDIPDFRRALLMVRRGKDLDPAEFAIGSRDSGARAVAWAISRTENPDLLSCVGIDVTATRNEFELLRVRATTDELTGLPNRAGLIEQLKRYSGSGATVVFCDLNGFKGINDTLGHAAGDALLVQVARRLRRTVRGEDFVARMGGDEFVILVPADPPSDFNVLANRLLRTMTQPIMLPGGTTATIGMSIGEAVLEPGMDAEAVLCAADQNMYRMKSRRPTRSQASVPGARAVEDASATASPVAAAPVA